LKQLGVKHLTSSVEHPQTNGQAEAANKVILGELRKKLCQIKGLWAEEIPGIPWGYHYTPQSSTKETPYRITYGSDATILLELGEVLWRRRNYQEEDNDDNLRVELDLVQEVQDEARVGEEAAKIRAA